jgi:hypothetical protein
MGIRISWASLPLHAVGLPDGAIGNENAGCAGKLLNFDLAE